VLTRRTVVVEDESGPVRVKLADRQGRRTGNAEADDVAAAGGSDARSRARRSAVARALRRAGQEVP